jgi:hypothetical protein
MKAIVYRDGMIMILTFVILILLGWQISFVIDSILLFMEMTQIDPNTYILLYVPTTLGLTIIWIGLHHYFIKRFKPNIHGIKNTRASPTELSKVNSLQFSMVMLCVLIVAISLVFTTEFPGNIAPGDGHIVQSGMDTSSAIYTLWLLILCSILVGGTYFIIYGIHLPLLYLVDFREPQKEAQQ